MVSRISDGLMTVSSLDIEGATYLEPEAEYILLFKSNSNVREK